MTARKDLNVRKGTQGFIETEKAKPDATVRLGDPDVGETLVAERNGSTDEGIRTLNDAERVEVRNEEGDVIGHGMIVGSEPPVNFDQSVHMAYYEAEPNEGDMYHVLMDDGDEEYVVRRNLSGIRNTIDAGDRRFDPNNVGLDAAETSEHGSVYYLGNRKAVENRGSVSIYEDDKLVDKSPVPLTARSAGDFIRNGLITDEPMRDVVMRSVSLGVEDRVSLAKLHEDLNEGAWGDINERSKSILHSARHENEDMQKNPLLTDAIEGTYGNVAPRAETLNEHASRWPTQTDYRAARAVEDAAFALAHRQYVDDERVSGVAYGSTVRTGWTKEAYEHMTRPFHIQFGKVHPDDDDNPESWNKRPLTQEN